jgi:hypothetical protein
MHEVIGGCKVCGKQMLTDRSPVRHRTCDACKAEHRRENHRRTDARRKAERHAAKAAMETPRCEQCGQRAGRIEILISTAFEFSSKLGRQNVGLFV